MQQTQGWSHTGTPAFAQVFSETWEPGKHISFGVSNDFTPK